MNQDEQNEQNTPEETPAEETPPAEETSAEDAPPAEETSAEDAPPAEEAPAEDSPPAEETPAEDAPAEDAAPEEAAAPDEPAAADASAADEEPAAEEPVAEEPAPEQAPAPEKAEKKQDVVPGADLEPISLEQPEANLSAEERARLEAEAEEKASREADLPDEPEDAPVLADPSKLHANATYSATGKRKSSVARVIIKKGGGTLEINSRPFEDYFPRPYLQIVAKQALVQTGYEDSVDVRVRVHGGGLSGQASAVRHGIAKALVEIDPELRKELKRRGMLTRDARVKERYKAGLKKARKRPQFSKR